MVEQAEQILVEVEAEALDLIHQVVTVDLELLLYPTLELHNLMVV